MKLALYILIIICIVWFCHCQRRTYIEINGSGVSRNWQVSNEYDNSAAAAALLASTHAKLLQFLRYLKEKYHIDETDDVAASCAYDHDCAAHAAIVANPNDTYRMVAFLLDNYNPEVMIENDPRKSEDTSYTLNKGERMFVCLRQRKNPARLVDPDALMFVLIHEMAHILNYDNIGHDTIYWRRFKWLLGEAAASGVYTPIDYSKYPITYCGLHIAYNPYYDNTLKDI